MIVLRRFVCDPTAVTITIYDVRGERVREIVMPIGSAGKQVVEWRGLDDNGEELASGVYFVRLRASTFSQVRKIVLVR